MEKQSEIVIVPYEEGRYTIRVKLEPLITDDQRIRQTYRELHIEVDPEFGINVAATGSLDPRDIPIFSEALGMAKLLANGTLHV